MRQPESLASLTASDPTFAHDVNGSPITRERVCECGRAFGQRLLSPRFLETCERHGRGAIAAVTRQIPDYFVPVHCPPCERRDIGRHARVDEARLVRSHIDEAAD